jgi:hypothetical protein
MLFNVDCLVIKVLNHDPHPGHPLLTHRAVVGLLFLPVDPGSAAERPVEVECSFKPAHPRYGGMLDQELPHGINPAYGGILDQELPHRINPIAHCTRRPRSLTKTAALAA